MKKKTHNFNKYIRFDYGMHRNLLCSSSVVEHSGYLQFFTLISTYHMCLVY